MNQAYIEVLLEKWGMWRLSANRTGTEWANLTPLYNMMKAGQVVKSTAPSYGPEDAIAERINLIVKAIGLYKRDQAEALIIYYEHPGWSIDDCAKKLKIPRTTFAGRLERAREAIGRAFEGD